MAWGSEYWKRSTPRVPSTTPPRSTQTDNQHMPQTWGGYNNPISPQVAPSNTTQQSSSYYDPTTGQVGYRDAGAGGRDVASAGSSGGGGGSNQPFGPFASEEQWAQQFQQEHGRLPNQTDYLDAIDSFNFLDKTGRAPTRDDWLTRYYTGSWFGGSGGGYGGGGGGGSRQQSYTSGPSSQYFNPNMTYWNIR